MARGSMRTVVAVVLVAVGVPTATAATAAAKARPLPLGPSTLTEHRTTTSLARGVTLTEIVRGAANPSDAYVVDVGFTLDRAQAESTAARLRAFGHDARLQPVAAAAPDAPPTMPRTGYYARVGHFATSAEAQAEAARIKGEGFTGVNADFTGDDGTRTTGPWRLHVLTIDPRRFRGSVSPVLATRVVPGRELVTSIAARTRALAAVNGGYFVIGPEDGTPGDLAGISVIHGDLVSEAIAGRTDLVLPHLDGGGAKVARVTTSLGVRAADGAARVLDGRNRHPGLIRSCGGVGGDQPTQRPLHDVTCKDPSELIQFTPRFGSVTDAASEVEAVLDAGGRVTAVRPPGGPIPRDGSVLAGTGDGAQWIRDHARVGQRVRVRVRVRQNGRALALRRSLSIVNGGPLLLRNRRVAITADREGFTHPADPEFYVRFGVRRNPRTIAGVTRRGRLLVVAADGRAPGYGVGLSFREEASVLRALGAADALNLDGGGSTAMTRGTRLLTRPSDATGERPIGDAIAVRATRR